MNSPSIIERSFQGWKMWLAIAIGLFVAGWMLYHNISEARFLKVETGQGNYSWRDSNGNNLVDQNLPGEFYLDPKNGDYKRETLGDSLAEANWTSQSIVWLFIAVLFMVGRDLFYIIRIRLLTNKELSYKSGFYVIMLWEFASALSPGVVGGAAVAMFILNREKIALGRSTSIVIVTAMLDNLFYVLLIPLVFLFIDQQDLFPRSTGGDIAVKWVFWIGFSVILAVCTFLFASIFLLPKLATKFLSFFFRLPILNRWRDSALQTGRDIEIASREMRKETFLFWLKVFGATCASWISRYLVINAILQAFLSLGFIDHIVILGKQLVLWLFMLVSPTPGGSGVAEYAFGELLSSFSSSALLLTALAVLWRLISYFPYLFIGAILLPRWIRKTARIDQSGKSN
jgi:glycosyltransferase 2 family protein